VTEDVVALVLSRAVTLVFWVESAVSRAVSLVFCEASLFSRIVTLATMAVLLVELLLVKAASASDRALKAVPEGTGSVSDPT
jgi:hypothetical protein